jgi:NitT/TauT family transport system permease protein
MVRLYRTLATLVVIVAVWEVVARAFFPVYILPPPSTIFAALFRIISDGTIIEPLLTSVRRAVVGYVLAVALAIPAGMVTGWWKVADHTIGSVFELLRPIPAVALIPLAVIWLGYGEEAKYAIIAYAAFFSVYINTHAGVRNVDPLYVRVMRVYGNGTWDILTKVVLYSMLPYVFTGLRYSAAVALILLVSAELVGGQSGGQGGLGFYLSQQQAFLQVPEVFSAIFLFGAMGFAANLVLLAIERRAIRWRQEVGSES